MCVRLVLFGFLLALTFQIYAQKSDTLQLDLEASESIFLKENLLLLAEKLQIEQAEALLVQAKLWPNPTLNIEEVNLWASQKQLGYFGDELPPLFGNRGRNQQISIQLEQLILTAGKRRKLMAIEEVSIDLSRQYFEDLLRNLRTEFRKIYYNLYTLQQMQLVYERQLISVRQLLRAYQRQVEEGNIGRGEYVRLKALELELFKEKNDLQREIYDFQNELRILMRLSPQTYIQSTAMESLPIEELRQSELTSLTEQSLERRTDMKIVRLEQVQQEKRLSYERSLRVPDLQLKSGYDRGGNFMIDFIGFGLGFDLPLFNRNQGYIQYAKSGLERSEILRRQKENEVQSEVLNAYQNAINALAFYEAIEPGFDDELDALLDSYTRNFAARNISLLEYLDFAEAYVNNKRIIRESERDVYEKIEELRFATGVDW
ncbi:MAG: TolC family protein [Cyclobacteriaceae bacterium]|nr:TolC family protein [Cyclobacteriaceae bacterium]